MGPMNRQGDTLTDGHPTTANRNVPPCVIDQPILLILRGSIPLPLWTGPLFPELPCGFPGLSSSGRSCFSAPWSPRTCSPSHRTSRSPYRTTRQGPSALEVCSSMSLLGFVVRVFLFQRAFIFPVQRLDKLDAVIIEPAQFSGSSFTKPHSI